MVMQRKISNSISGVLLLLGMFVLGGCHDSSKPSSFNTPAQPVGSQYAVTTDNYFYRYGSHFTTLDGKDKVADPPFDPIFQFASSNYPLSISYQRTTEEPVGFSLVPDTIDSVRCWAQADPRVCALSGVNAADARIEVVLEKTIVYGEQTNIIGLTTVIGSSTPCFKVEVATSYQSSGLEIDMPANEVEKTLAHELGHALGLGHSPDKRDLMHFQSNDDQGASYETFLTYGDASAVWTTLNARKINWVPSRPTITEITPTPVTVTTRGVLPRGQVVCIYTR